MEPLTSWAIFIVIAAALAWRYGLFEKLTAKPEVSGPARGRTQSRADAKLPDWVLEAEKKAGTAAKAVKKQAPRKSVKKAVEEVGNKVEAAVAAVSSTTVADANDKSPSLVAQVTNKIPNGKDVSDMLDPTFIPGVLKVTASDKPVRPAKPQQKKSEPQTQTKKQAQNAKKREAEKAAQAETEALRLKQMEQQLATARKERGEAPGARYRSAQAPISNAWNNAEPPVVSKPVTGQLLDTFDGPSSSSPAPNGTTPTLDSTSYDNLPSEEEQIAAALADSAWTTVPKGKKKKTKAEGDAVGEESDSGTVNEPSPVLVKATPAPAPKKEAKREVGKPTSRYEGLSGPISDFKDPRDSDWPVV